MVEPLKHYFHQLILDSYELLHLWAVVSIISQVVVGLTIAVIVPRVQHLRNFW
jgi:ABC-type sugar transport system permease subunit